ncbi:MAG TPA: hypothetical protein VE684_07245 [Crenalkalicoccus sp.]|nr:hypothetical protein [Crenalkalicoccus sp.]
MMDALMVAGQRLAEALAAENEALAALDLRRAAGLATAKIQASEAFAAAYTTATRQGVPAAGLARDPARGLARRLDALGTENRRLLERAIAIQSRVIETIATAARPASVPPTYGPAGRRALPRAGALALAVRA